MRVRLCKACVSLPRYGGFAVVFESIGAGDCSACKEYVCGQDGVEVWVEEDAVLAALCLARSCDDRARTEARR